MRKKLALLLILAICCLSVSSNDFSEKNHKKGRILQLSDKSSFGANNSVTGQPDNKDYAKDWRTAEKEIGRTIGAKCQADFSDWTIKCKKAGWSDEKIEYYRWLINEHYKKKTQGQFFLTENSSDNQSEQPIIAKPEKEQIIAKEKTDETPVELVEQKEEIVVVPEKVEDVPEVKQEEEVEPVNEEIKDAPIVEQEEAVVVIVPEKIEEVPDVKQEELEPASKEVTEAPVVEQPRKEESGDKRQKKQREKKTATVSSETDTSMENYEISEGQEDSESETDYVPGLLHSSKDVYENNTAYNFSIAYYKARGYDNHFHNLCINGFQFNSLVTGRATYSQWGGLNHVMRYPESIYGLNVCTFNFGDIAGASNFNTRASSYRKQVRATYSLNNRNYTNRLMATYATGVLKNGWSVAACLSGRFGDGLNYVDGVTYNGFSYFLAVEKKFNTVHALNLTAWGAPTVRGMQASSVDEAYDITGTHYYNPNWGWYQGRQRNARMRTVHEPVIMLTHYYTPDSKLNMTTTLAVSFGRNSSTSLNWYDAQDPRPDYYRYLPSYQIDNGDTSSTYYDVLNAWQTDANVRQIDWNRLYGVNQLAAYQGKRAQYMLENRVYDHFLIGGVTNAIYTINEHVKFVYGVELRGIKQHNYKTIADLLSGLYWLDVDKYSEGEFPEDADVQYNDLDNKDKQLHEGDVFGYDFDYHILIEKAWAQFLFTYNKVDFNIGASIGGKEYCRVGHMRNGRFPLESKGKSPTKSFAEFAFKGGLTYKINGRNYLVLNGMYEHAAPSVTNIFVSPRIRNKYVDNLKCEKITSFDLSYVLKYPVITMRLTGYFAQLNDQTKLISFYHDGMQCMVNYSMTGIDERHLGVEFGTEIKLGSMFTLILAGNYGDYRYSDRAHVTINAENGTDIEGVISQDVYWKNYHVASGPQAAATIGIKFNYKYWWVNINANYFDKIYCDLNPERRTTYARGTLDVNDPAFIAMVSQTRLKGQFTLDASISKSWRIKRYTIGFNIGVTNILNNKNLVTTAWEQYRYDYTTYNPNKFQNKYYYAFGTTFFGSLNFQFN
jgi:hypothetical protein